MIPPESGGFIYGTVGTNVFSSTCHQNDLCLCSIKLCVATSLRRAHRYLPTTSGSDFWLDTSLFCNCDVIMTCLVLWCFVCHGGSFFQYRRDVWELHPCGCVSTESVRLVLDSYVVTRCRLVMDLRDLEVSQLDMWLMFNGQLNHRVCPDEQVQLVLQITGLWNERLMILSIIQL